MSDRTYLDYNATAPLRPQAYAAMQDVMKAADMPAANPSSVHAEGRRARALIETARQHICALVGGDMDGLVFTSSGTEACNLALQTRHAPAGEISRILVSAIEHPAILQAAAASDLPVTELGVNQSGVLDLAALAEALQDPAPALIAVMAANNETGTIQPIAQIGAMAHAHGSVFLCDAVQAVGKMPLDMQALHIDMLALSAHKIGGPMGSGALCVAPHISLNPLIYGGGQEHRRRAGTENLLGIVGFGAAAQCAQQDLAEIMSLAKLRDRLEADLRKAVPAVTIFAHDVARLPNTSCFSVAGVQAETLIMALDLDGIAVSAGSACSSGKVTRSHVLAAMGIADELAQGAIRVSLGWNSKRADSDRLVASWTAFVTKSSLPPMQKVAQRPEQRVEQAAE